MALSRAGPELSPPPPSPSPSPRSRQRVQERTPPGGAEARPSPGRPARPPPQLRVLLTPLARAGRPPQKRLLGAYEGGGGGGKRPRAASPSGPAAPPARDGDSGDGSDGSDGDDSDGGDEEPQGHQDGYSELSAYERKRLKNITENAKFFASLKLHESAARLQKIASKVQPHVTKRPRPRKAEEEPVRRRSMRLRRAEPAGAPEPEPPAQPDAEEYPRVPPGPVAMLPEEQKENSKATEEFLAMWTRISEMTPSDAQKPSRDLERYAAGLGRMALRAGHVAKVVKARVCSLALHPAAGAVLVAAGDKLGHVGLWNVDSDPEEGVHVFVPHSFPVSCMHFSPANPAHLLSLGYDSLRRGDVTRAVFDEICRGEESFSSFDFLEESASTVLVSRWDGAVALADARTPGTAPELSADIGFARTRTVHVHPVHRQYFVAAGSLDVRVYDVRSLRAAGNEAVSALEGHTKSVASAYFSPASGRRVVTVSADDKLRVYDTSSLSSAARVLSTVRHNNNTGRWLTRFRAIWDPKQEDCFVVGSMARPRQIEIYQDTGKLLHSFYNVDYLGSVCSINVVHPTKNILVGGNSSGRLHVFKE